MPRSSISRQVHARYAPLSALSPADLSTDEKRSLLFVRTVTDIVSGEIGPEKSKNRVVVWLRNFDELDAFVATHRRLPRDNRRAKAAAVSEVERHLEQWVNYQKRPKSQDLLCGFQRACFELIPGFGSERFDSRWAVMLREYARFVDVARQAPRLRSELEPERQLARWAAKQRLLARTGRLPAERREALNRLPFWGWGDSTVQGS